MYKRQPLSYGTTLSNLGTVYLGREDYSQAESTFRDALVKFEEANNFNENRNYVLIINDLAQINQSKGDNFKAKMMFYEAKKIKQKQYKNYEEDLEYILILNNIGLTHYSLKEYKTAKDTYQEAILLIKKHFLENINLYSILHSNLGLLFMRKFVKRIRLQNHYKKLSLINNLRFKIFFQYSMIKNCLLYTSPSPRD